MTIYPPAQWRPLADQQPARMARHDLVILHTMVGSLAGTDAMFHAGGYGGTESHFGVGYDGTTYQWVDLECRADANLDANDAAISIETADWGEGDFGRWDTNNPALVPAWTPAQVETIAHIVAWCCDRWDIPCELVADSRPGRRGVAYHRQGVDPYRVDGGEHWSTSYGKVCPGSRRIAQVPAVITRAREITNPAPPEDSEEDTMQYLVTYQGIWLVAGDLSTRTGFSSMADLNAVVGAGKAAGQKYATITLSPGQMARIPVAGSTNANLSDADLEQAAELNADAITKALAGEGSPPPPPR